MPTKPLETLLYRDLSKVAAKEILKIASPLLRELVNYSTNAFRRCEASTTGNENEDVAVLMLYLHLIEMIDGIEVLISESCPTPAEPLARSAFEALLSIEYILDSDYVRRSLSWLAVYVHNRIKLHESFDPSTPRGQAFQRAWVNDQTVQNITLPPADQAKAQAAIANLQDLLARPQFQPIEAEIKRQKRRNPKWYQLFGGPSNLRELAHHLRREAQYHVFYTHWSSISHAHDLSRFIGKTSDGGPGYKMLRDPDKIQEVTRHAANIMLAGTRLVLDKFRPQEDMNSWYLREVRKRFLELY
jgi:hypothetical protein